MTESVKCQLCKFEDQNPTPSIYRKVMGKAHAYNSGTRGGDWDGQRQQIPGAFWQALQLNRQALSCEN